MPARKPRQPKPSPAPESEPIEPPRPAPAPPVIAVHCAHTTMVDLVDLQLNPRNPNQHPEAQILLLMKIIEAQGWRSPIVVSNRSGFVVKGHGRVMAATRLACARVPVDFQDYPSDEAEMADLLADNRLAELSGNDNSILASLMQELQGSNIDLELAGFDQAAVASLLGDPIKPGIPHARNAPEFNGGDEGPLPPGNPNARPVFICQHCGKENVVASDPQPPQDEAP